MDSSVSPGPALHLGCAPNTALMGFVGEGFHPELHINWQWRAAGINVIPSR